MMLQRNSHRIPCGVLFAAPHPERAQLELLGAGLQRRRLRLETNYWSVMAGRLSRRRALIATGTTAATAAFLAGCGGGGSESGDGKAGAGDKSGLVTPL